MCSFPVATNFTHGRALLAHNEGIRIRRVERSEEWVSHAMPFLVSAFPIRPKLSMELYCISNSKGCHNQRERGDFVSRLKTIETRRVSIVTYNNYFGFVHLWNQLLTSIWIFYTQDYLFANRDSRRLDRFNCVLIFQGIIRWQSPTAIKDHNLTIHNIKWSRIFHGWKAPQTKSVMDGFWKIP